MILTRQKSIPWLWVALIATTAGVNALAEICSNNALTFTLKKFVSDPAAISFLGSINIAFNFLVAPLVAWKSDRIWTRFGRRKPFLLVGWSMLVLALIAAPLAPSLWMLIAVIIIWQFSSDFGYTGVWAPLFYEVIPSPQRGRGVVAKRVMMWAGQLFYNLVLIGQFDAIYNLKLGGGSFHITGEQVIYFTTATLVLMALLHILLNVREVPPENPIVGERFSPRTFFGSILGNRQWLLLYLLLFCNVAMHAGLGQLGPLLTTEQFGYTKGTMGKMAVAGSIVGMALVLPLAGILADRFDRFRVFQVGMFLSTLHPLGYWLFVKFAAAGQVPTPLQIVCWTVANHMIDTLAALSLEPLVFDLTPRDQMGTMNSGFTLVQGLLKWVVLTGVGFWVKYYSMLFGTPGQYDYMSGYLYVFILGLLGCMGTIYFARQRRLGRIVEYGKREVQADGSATPPEASDDAVAADAKG